MRVLSSLQRAILEECLEEGRKRLDRHRFWAFYAHHQKPRSPQKAITKSLERLIEREFLVGYGIRTPHKWFIQQVRLTPKGRKVARHLQGEQQTLKF
ncbi:MAG: hypothetical protein AAB733_04385 [Patescibacteria group bacterium]